MKTKCMFPDPLECSQFLPLPLSHPLTGSKIQGYRPQKVSSCKPPKLNNKAICDKMIGSPVVPVKLIDKLVAEGFM